MNAFSCVKFYLLLDVENLNNLEQFYLQDIKLYILVYTFVPIRVYVLQTLNVYNTKQRCINLKLDLVP